MRVLLTLLLALTCVAQERTASLTGTVVDATGARVVQARVQLEAPSGAKTVVRVDEVGAFRFGDLAAGVYQLQIEASGFMLGRVRDIKLELGEQRSLADIKLEVGTQF
jgi:hypothetical protein